MTININAALTEYANPLNWDVDANGVRRIWREPGSDTPDAYNGFEMARAALTTAAAVPPEGWVMVPVEATVSMREAMQRGTGMSFSETKIAYNSMLAAAPKAEPVPTDHFPDAGKMVAQPALWDEKKAVELFESARAGSNKPVGVLRGIRAVIAAWEGA